MNPVRIVQLRCEYLFNPLGIDERVPRLSWQMESERRGARQRAFRVLVASSSDGLAAERPDLWDSGVVESDQSAHVEYRGLPLSSRTQCHWRVEVTDDSGSLTRSEPSLWTLGLLEPSDWSACWIAADPEIVRRDASAVAPSATEPGTPGLFRREFDASAAVSRAAVTRATVYASARGLLSLFLNGQRVGDDLFAPEWTDYHRRIHYRTYDVTQLLRRGRNCLAATLGDGWWSGYVGWQQRGRYGSLENSLLVQLEVEFTDGSIVTVGSDGSWTCQTGPILSSDFMMGETYDARRERPGWNAPGYGDASTWLAARQVPAPTAQLVAQRSEPIRVHETLAPVSLAEVEPTVFIFDLGQNISGWVRLSLPPLPAGTRIVLRHGERLDAGGALYTENLRRAKATDVYVARGGERETWQPQFTFHGFQYVELRGLPADTRPDLTTVTGCAIYSALAPTGHFECSHPGVNRLWRNIVWSQKDNFISIPTDCPQRDERLGWTGDAQVFLRTATCNMDVAAFFTKWMIDVEDAQTPDGVFPDTAPRLREDESFIGPGDFEGGPGWADAGVIVPYTLWRVYGDRRILKRHYAAMVRWVDWIERHNPDGLRRNQLGNNYGDWLCIPTDTSFRTHSPMKTLLATAYWAKDCSMLARIALELGHAEDAERFAGTFAKIRAAFQQEWLLGDGQLAVETQTAYLLALAFDLLPREVRASAAQRLAANIREQGFHLSTGFIGVGHLNPQLTLTGYADVAYRLLLQDTYPAWLYPVKNGATTIWERWNGWTEESGFFEPRMNSFNHYSLGSVGEWLFRHVAGIELDTETAGSQHFSLCPFVGEGLRYVRARIDTLHGQVESNWRQEQDLLIWSIRIPANASASVGVPMSDPAGVLLDGAPLTEHPLAQGVQREAGRSWLTLPAGSYEFVCTRSSVEP